MDTATRGHSVKMGHSVKRGHSMKKGHFLRMVFSFWGQVSLYIYYMNL